MRISTTRVHQPQTHLNLLGCQHPNLCDLVLASRVHELDGVALAQAAVDDSKVDHHALWVERDERHDV